MGTIRIAAASLVALAAACGGGDSKAVDALIIIPDAAIDAPPDAFEPQFDFACMGNAAPTTATANITMSGAAIEVFVNGIQPGVQASHDATVDVCQADCANADLLDTKTMPASGCPAMGCPYSSSPIATGGTPLDGYVKVSKTGNRTTYIYPPSAFTADFAMLPAVTFTDGVIALLGVAGITQTAGNGFMMIAVADCSNMPITETANVTLSVKQGGVAVPDTTQVDASMFAAQLAGTFLVFNVPPGVTEIGATYKTHTLRAHDVTVFADSATASAIRPGF